MLFIKRLERLVEVPKKPKRPAFTKDVYTFDEVNELTAQAVKAAIDTCTSLYKEEIRVLERMHRILSGMCESFKSELEELKLPRGRGRPKKKKEFKLSEILGRKEKRKGGRPLIYNNPHEKIAEWDSARATVAIKSGKKSIADLQLINHIMDNDKTLSYSQRNEFTRQIRSAIKQLRDKTGVRIHKRKKAENPPK